MTHLHPIGATPSDNAYNRGLIEWNAQWLDTLSFAKCPDLASASSSVSTKTRAPFTMATQLSHADAIDPRQTITNNHSSTANKASCVSVNYSPPPPSSNRWRIHDDVAHVSVPHLIPHLMVCIELEPGAVEAPSASPPAPFGSEHPAPGLVQLCRPLMPSYVTRNIPLSCS